MILKLIKKDDRLKHLTDALLKDKELKHHNIKNNIPDTLENIDSLFYDLNKNVSIPLLDKMHHEYEMIFLNGLKIEKNETIANEIPDDLLEVEPFILPQIHIDSNNEMNIENQNSNISNTSNQDMRHMIVELNGAINLIPNDIKETSMTDITHQSLDSNGFTNIQNHRENLIDMNNEIADLISQNGNRHNFDVFADDIDALDLMSLPLLRR